MAERGESHLVVGLDLEHLAERVVGLVGPALGGQGIGEVAPGLGRVGLELGDLAQVVHGVVRARLHAGAAGNPEQLYVVRGFGQAGDRLVVRLAEASGVEFRASLLQGRHPAAYSPTGNAGVNR